MCIRDRNGSISPAELAMGIILSLSIVGPLMKATTFINEAKSMEYAVAVSCTHLAWNWNSLSGYVCALVAESCLNDEIAKGKAYNLDEIEGIQNFIESLPGEIKQNIVKL